MQATYSGSDKRLAYLFQNANHVTASADLVSGEKVGTISIDGQDVDLYAPEQTSVACQTIADQGTAVAVFTIDNQDYIIYCPVTSDISYDGHVSASIIANETSGGQTQAVYSENSYKIGSLTIRNGEDYKLTTDTTVVSGKAYYSKTMTYTAVTPSAGASPVLNGWYELVNGVYVKSSDTTVVSGKTYYQGIATYTTVVPQGNENPQQEGWYESTVEAIPLYAPPATGVEYESNYNQGIVVGKMIVRSISHDPQHEDQSIVSHKEEFNIIIPSGSAGGSIVSYNQVLSSGTLIGEITIDGVTQNIYAPSGGGNVADVYVDGSSVLDSNHIAQISLSGYATNSALQSAIAALQASFQDGVEQIYDACVRKGSTPASHSLTDVVAAIYAIGGSPMAYGEANSDNTVIPQFETTVEVV